MAVSEDRKFTKEQVYTLLEGAKGKTLGEVDKSHQFARTLESKKITGIAGDVIEQSVFGYKKDSKQECDIEIDGVLTEVKTTGVRVPKRDQKNAKGKTGEAYNVYLGAKEGISITHVTFEPPIQTDFDTSHFWEKTERLLIIFYEYRSYEVVPASGYAKFPIVDYCYNSFSQEEKDKLQNDWEIVSSHLQQVYHDYQDAEKRNEQLVGFTHLLRPNLLLIELVPGFKRTATGSYQKPRYRLKQTFVDYIVRGHFDKSRAKNEIVLKESFSSFAQLDARDADFEDSDVYDYFCEHSFLCPIFCEHDSKDPSKTVFEGFKRFAFDEEFIENEVRRTWEDSRNLIHRNELEWEYVYDKKGNKRMNNSGSYMGAPNFPKSSEYKVFFRGGADVSTEKTRTESVNGIRMLPQFFWLKGSYIAKKLQEIPYI